ncbi:uncharacterized protein [Narcine bancroftii]|uniref:uncharacterized protein isoform X2 n=1 Tax=Narcine bancroftii TaxID=1343680 RepID=UPI003831D4EA
MSFPKQQALEGTQKGGEEKKMLQFVEMVYVLFYLLTIWSVFTSFRMCEAVPFQSQKNTTNILQPRSCWENEEYSIIRACSPCTDYEKTVYTECTFTGFVEELKCAEDRRYKRNTNTVCFQVSLSHKASYFLWEPHDLLLLISWTSFVSCIKIIKAINLVA